MRRLAVAAVLALTPAARAGDLSPSYLDPCRSPDGRFVVTAEVAEGPQPDGPFRWRITWADTKTGEKKSFVPKELSAGKAKGQLFVTPDGKSIAVWNHVLVYFPGKGGIHFKEVDAPKESDEWRGQEAFSRRLVIYTPDGTLVKSLGVKDFLTADEWGAAGASFNRLIWLAQYDGLQFKQTPRPAYAFTRVSPDYSVLEFRVVAPRASKDKTGRVVRVSLADGRVLAADEKLPEARTPVRMFAGPDKVPAGTNAELFVPSLDPVREEGKYAPAPKK